MSTKVTATLRIENASLSVFVQNVDGVHTHRRNGKRFVGNQQECPLCKNGSEFEKSLGKIGA